MSEKPPIDSFQGEYRWLSNFWPALVKLGGMAFPTVEHAYQAAKTDDPVMRAHICMLPRPHQAKHWGRKVKMREDWETHKLDVMLDLLRLKFVIPELQTQLLATGTRELIEGNTWGDTFWGVCQGRGQNHLGRLLMQVRDEIGGRP